VSSSALDRDDNRQRPEASHGQILIMVALFLTGLLGAVGLVMDLGYAFSQRRTVQNAADAASMAGARALLHWEVSDPGAPWREVQELALHPTNRIADTNQTIAACQFVNDADAKVGECADGAPSTATGVRVTVTETHSTFFMQVVPGAPDTVTTSASATAHVQLMNQAVGDGPFIICSYDTVLEKGGKMSILKDDGTFNPAAYGETFVIHGSQVARCGLSNSSFKGLADQEKNTQCKQRGNKAGCLDQYWYADNGVKDGPTRVKVNGMQGCEPGQAANCVMILPIATNNPAPISSNPRQYYVVQMAAFFVSEGKGEKHTGTLLEDYVIAGDGQPGWCPTCGGIAVVRQTG
jgi:Flp pilus assembly protein TadG